MATFFIFAIMSYYFCQVSWSGALTMQQRKARLQKTIFLSLSLIFILAQVGSVSAAPNPPTGPDRFTAIQQEYFTYTWWMMTWAENELVCEISIEHEGLPYYNDVYVDCGEGLADAWLEQDTCDSAVSANTPEQCPGYYLFLADTESAIRDVAIPLPAPVVWIFLPDCSEENGTSRCERPPVLVLQGEEPLAGEKILSINGNLKTETFSCQGSRCELPINETDEDGIELWFWATSSYGDTSDSYHAKIRVTAAESEQGDIYWYVDVLSSQWLGDANASCAESWEAFPPEGGVPFWLSSPKSVDELETDLAYSDLAGTLIETGVVDASQCADFGVDEFGQATACGLEAATPAMTDWQNRFDQLILDAAVDTQVPAVLLKRLFARESQFWPGAFNEGTDVGLGQLTVEGADFAFLWNPIFFEQFCPLALDDSQCQQGYLNLSEEDQSYLRETLVYSVNATCTTCPLGVDLTQADLSVSVFANTLRASCEQTGSVVYNNTGRSPGDVASYEDLWRFTLVNYNAGAGCLGLAIDATQDLNQALTWENLSENLTDVCKPAKDYVNDISDKE